MDNYAPTTFIIIVSRRFKFLLISDFVFLISIIFFVLLGNIGPFHLSSYALFYLLFLSAGLSVPIGATTTIAAFYIFFRTFKKKEPALHTYNIFSRYILIAVLTSLLFMIISYGIINLIDHKATTDISNIIGIVATSLFVIINISGFFYLATAYRKYTEYINSAQPKP